GDRTAASERRSERGVVNGDEGSQTESGVADLENLLVAAERRQRSDIGGDVVQRDMPGCAGWRLVGGGRSEAGGVVRHVHTALQVGGGAHRSAHPPALSEIVTFCPAINGLRYALREDSEIRNFASVRLVAAMHRYRGTPARTIKERGVSRCRCPASSRSGLTSAAR